MDKKLCKRWNDAAKRYSENVAIGNSDPAIKSGWEEVYGDALEGCAGRLLDCGCGPGTVTMYVAGPRFRITALDQSEEMLRIAKRNTESEGIDAEFVQGDAENLPFEDGSFDVVVCQHMLWTVPDPQKVIHEWFRILRPGGRLVYTDADWFNYPKKTRARIAVSHLMTSFDKRETRAQRSKREKMEEFVHLWSARAHRPAEDLRMLSAAGFSGAKVRNGIERLVTHGVSYWRYGILYNYFLVSAEKPERRLSDRRDDVNVLVSMPAGLLEMLDTVLELGVFRSNQEFYKVSLFYLMDVYREMEIQIDTISGFTGTPRVRP
ncbi:MAG: methyltransferase domain-containing protein, partial [Candidatus Methanomethylophilaceae archaeon]|nr:methyltransferase domain-containing protein [Candidatus Methanomethylophilaceae archaeon]